MTFHAELLVANLADILFTFVSLEMLFEIIAAIAKKSYIAEVTVEIIVTVRFQMSVKLALVLESCATMLTYKAKVCNFAISSVVWVLILEMQVEMSQLNEFHGAKMTLFVFIAMEV